jgi:hypothetical protein
VDPLDNDPQHSFFISIRLFVNLSVYFIAIIRQSLHVKCVLTKKSTNNLQHNYSLQDNDFNTVH